MIFFATRHRERSEAIQFSGLPRRLRLLAMTMVGLGITTSPISASELIQEGLYEMHGTLPNRAPYSGTASLNRLIDGRYAVKWCMGRVYHGEGQVVGSQLVVKWGSNWPVVYAAAGNRLDGIWANGNATDQLTLRYRGPGADCERDRIRTTASLR